LFDATGNPDIKDEYTFGQLQDIDTATAALTAHWNTFITEDDFAAIAAAGYFHSCSKFLVLSHLLYCRLNHVRIPIGYWAFDVSEGEPYIQGQYPYLKQAVTWAQNHGLRVLIDLHGAPGSQVCTAYSTPGEDI
jgi:glucan 1,3-beta-glucosidase